MRKAPVLTLLASAATVAGFAVALRAKAFPLGVSGEWEWLRLTVAPQPLDVTLAGAGVAAFAVFSGLGMAALRSHATPLRETLAVLSLLAASVAVQGVAQWAAPTGYGLEKWVVALSQKGSSGYFTVAKHEVRDPWDFLSRYPEWITRQDALHIGTHPPGLILLETMLLRAFERSPAAARFVEGQVPRSVTVAFRVLGHDQPMSAADRATLAATGCLTLLACAGTVVPLYVLVRANNPAAVAWGTAALWPLVPSAILFQPAADTAFPFLSTAALASAALAGAGVPGTRRRVSACLAGVCLGIGMQFTLAFLPAGLIVALMVLGDRQPSWRERISATLLTGLGFLGLTLGVWALTRANPFIIWWWNHKNHARFYDEFPRSFLAWVVANPVELAVGLGLPTAFWATLGLGSPRSVPRAGVATAAVLALLTLSGKNLSEVARLWLPFMPAFLFVAGATLSRLGAGPKTVAATVALVGAQTLILETMIQVVYPI